MVKERTMAGYAYPVTHSDGEWCRLLTQEQYDVMRGHRDRSTRQLRAAAGEAARHILPAQGATCFTLFRSRLKFESGNGWPSFNDPIEGSVETSTIAAMAWSEPKCIAPIAAAIWDTCSTTVRRRRIFKLLYQRRRDELQTGLNRCRRLPSLMQP